MKSHLIPDPKPIEPHLNATDSAQMYLLDQFFMGNSQRSAAKFASEDESHRVPEMPMRNFLRVVFAG